MSKYCFKYRYKPITPPNIGKIFVGKIIVETYGEAEARRVFLRTMEDHATEVELLDDPETIPCEEVREETFETLKESLH